MRGLVLLLICAGCSTSESTDGPAVTDVPVTCDAKNWRDLIGQPEEALYGAYANLRVIHPGDDVTDDFNPNRLNAVIGADGRIKEFGCY